MNLGTLEPVNVRDIWAGEATHFTPWLALPENLEILGDTLGISLEPVATEASVGPYYADIVCKDESDNTNVLIENQLEKTDHRHLGQIFTYAAGLDAVKIVWIAPQFTDEHKAAIDWLNSISTDEFSFFAIEIELWKIADSPPAPRFNVVAGPNDWSRAVKRGKTGGGSSSGEASELRLKQLEFWEGFKEYLNQNRSPIHCQKPGYRHWMWHSIGKSGVALCSVAVSGNSMEDAGEVRAVFNIHDDLDGERLEKLRPLIPDLEKALGQTVNFDSSAGDAKRSKISVSKHFVWTDPENANSVYSWLDEKHRGFLAVLKGRLNEI